MLRIYCEKESAIVGEEWQESALVLSSETARSSIGIDGACVKGQVLNKHFSGAVFETN